MSFEKLYNEVLSKDLCASCGLCESVCPHNLITINSNTPKLLNVLEEEQCGDCTLCHDICPGADPSTPESELMLFGRTRTEEERWLGIYERTMNGYSTDPEIFKNSASGGCATTTLLTAKEALGLDYLIVAGYDPQKPWLGTAKTIQNKEQALESTQSKYQIFPLLKGIKEFLKSRSSFKLGVSALPCQVQALRKLQNLDNEVGKWAKEHIVFIIEIACSSNTSFVGTEALINEVQLSTKSVKKISYREGEYPGDFVVEDVNNAKHKIPLWEAVREFKAYKTHRCLSCGDWMSGLADVSFCDGDPNIFASSLNPSHIDKQGKIMIRTAVGEEVFQYALDNHKLECWEGEIKTMNLGLERKKNRRATYERLECEIPKPPIPDYAEKGEIISDERLLRMSGSLKDKD